MGRDTLVRPPRKPRRGRRALKIALLALVLVLLAILSMLGGAYVSVARTLPSLELADRVQSSETTKIYDSSPTPVLLTELRGLDDRQILEGDDIPQVMRDALVAAEDPRFYEHKGMGFFTILRAAWANARHRQVAAGGSTITQQLIKNAFVSDEQKAADGTLEPAIAYALESRWTKEKILNEYLNYVYFGSGSYGIQAAARMYFGVDAKDLTLTQAALLAGLPSSPSAYSPRRDPEAALARRDLVLNKMYQQRYISSQQLQEALEAPLLLADTAASGGENEPYWVDLLREQLIARYGSSTVMNGGLRVFAGMNTQMQQAAEKAVDDALAQAGGGAGESDAASTLSATLVAVDVDSGQLVAMVSADKSPGLQLNLATQGRWATGSSLRPFVLATALEQGISPEATYDSGPTTLGPANGAATVTSTDEGQLTLAQALARSSSGVFARLITELGPYAVAGTSADMGVPVSSGAITPAIALEGPTGGMTTLEMAMAYATLAQGGQTLSADVIFDPTKDHFPVSIVKVTDAQGNLLDENGVERTRVMDRGLAELLTSLLQSVIEDGTGRAADIGRPAAGENGLSDDGRSAWFVGYTPELVTAVWVGYPDKQNASAGTASTGEPIATGPVTDPTLPAQVWAKFMTAALADTPVSDFSIAYAAKWVTVDVCSESRLLPTELCPTIVKRLFRSDELPTDTCDLHVPQAVFMPNVVGLTFSKAKGVLSDANLKVRTVSDASSLQPAGVVTKQDHSAGKPVLQGTEIVLHVSAGQAVSVPALADLTLEAAQAKLAAVGLAAEVTEQASDTVALGVVISQDPASGTVAMKGSTVRLVVSSGPASPPST
jgi:penicillin-binding protein 1A